MCTVDVFASKTQIRVPNFFFLFFTLFHKIELTTPMFILETPVNTRENSLDARYGIMIPRLW